MAPKRKAPSHEHKSPTNKHQNKRTKRSYIIISSSDSEDSDLAEGEYLIKCILGENETQYLIDWEGPWNPTWVCAIGIPSRLD